MKSKNKKKFTRIAFILNGFLFLMNGIVLINDNQLVFGLLHLVAVIFNFGMLYNFKNFKVNESFDYIIFVLNIIICIIVAIQYIEAGKSYIQYAWFIAALFSTIALILKIKKRKIVSNSSI